MASVERVRKRTKVVVAVVVVLVAAVGAGAWWYLRDDAPAEVSLDAATEGLEGTTTTGDAGDDEGEPAAIEGTWRVDTESGDFDFESATGTFAGFRIEEQLSSIGATTAVGRTGDVTGTMEIEGTTVTAARFEVDLSTITTNEGRRDRRVQEALETGTFPIATFELIEPIDLGDRAAAGEVLAVVAVGELTIHGVTRPAEFALEARLVDETVAVVGSTEVTFSDFGVEVPSAPIVLSVEDHGILELQLLLVRG